MKKILLATILLISGATYAQNVGIGTKRPDESAILDLNSSSKGLLLPRLSEKQRTVIPSPAEGLIVYQNDGNKGIYIYQSGKWNNITSLSSTNTRMMNASIGTLTPNYLLIGDSNGDVATTNKIFIDNSGGFYDGNIGFGTNSPLFKIDVLTDKGAAFRFKSTDSTAFSTTSWENNRGQRAIFLAYGSAYTSGSFLGVGANGVGFVGKEGKFGIGTETYHPLIFGANNSEVLRVDPNGNVGIGTTSPSFKFDILTGSGDAFRLKSNNSTTFSKTLFQNDASSGISVLTYGSAYPWGTVMGVGPGGITIVGTGKFAIGTESNDPLIFGVNTYEYARISTNGNLLVGGTSDDNTARLNVTGSIKQSDVTSKYLRADANGKLVAAAVSEDNSNANANLIRIDSKSAGYLAVGDFTGSGLTSFPTGYRMIVQDGILTERMNLALKSSQSWADYVFEPSYRLMPLNEVEEFVKENKHLPNVPSADEMVQKGLDVAQTSKMFMEKIEELTLYMIELKKEVEALKAENSRLK